MFKSSEAIGVNVDSKNQHVINSAVIRVLPHCPNSCCGAMIEMDSSSRWSRKGNKNRDFGAPFFWTHTMGIRVFPGRVEGELPMFKGEERVEVPFKNDTLTLVYVKDYIPFEKEAPKDTEGGRINQKKVPNDITLINTTATQPLLFPIFNAFTEFDPTRLLTIHNLVHDYGYSQEQAEAYVVRNTTRFAQLKAQHNKGIPLFFTVTTTQEPNLLKHLEKYGMRDSVIFHRSNIHNMNYSEGDNPRLAIVIVKGKE